MKLRDEHLLHRVTKKEHNHERVRECSTCTKRWKTQEVPLYKLWSGDHPHYCPRCGARGRQLATRTAEVARRNTYRSQAIYICEYHGAIWRRYGCSKCETRWTTGEFDGRGLQVGDIRDCPRCGEKGKPYRPTKVEARRAQAASTAAWLERRKQEKENERRAAESGAGSER